MNRKVVIVYPFTTGEKAFSGGVSKVIVSNIIAAHMNGDTPYMVLPIDNKGLIEYVRDQHPFCQVIPLDFKSLSLFMDVKSPWKRIKMVWSNLKGYFRGKRLIKNFFKELQPDVIHYHDAVLFPMLGFYKKAKVIMHIHTYRFTSFGILFNIICNSINKNADVIISPTASIKAAVQPHISRKVTIVDTPYLELGNTDEIQPNQKLEQIKDKGVILFSFIGRICRIKRIDHFLKAIAALEKEKITKMKFVIIGGCNTPGDEAYKKEMESFIKDNNLTNVVEFVGYVNPIESALKCIDYGTLLTESEAMPMVGIEYMRFGIPIIGYDAPGINDFLVTGENGYLLENGDYLAITKVLDQILTQKEKNDMRDTISKRYEKHSLTNFAGALDVLY